MTVDGRQIHQGSYDPHGLSGDGPSIGAIYAPLQPKAHAVEVKIGRERWSGEVELHQGRRSVLRFDDAHGFNL